MEFSNVLVSLFSIGGIAFTYWFFLMKKDDEAVVIDTNNVDIIVEGGYSPNTISVPKNKQVTLNFTRRDPSSCLEEIIIPDFKIRKYLPLNKTTSIIITAKNAGTYELSCGMNMFHGKIIVQ